MIPTIELIDEAIIKQKELAGYKDTRRIFKAMRDEAIKEVENDNT